MFSEGYSGEQVCVLSASGDAFWREVNIEMLFRDVGTATVFDAQWGGSENFTDWVAYYAANVVMRSEGLGDGDGVLTSVSVRRVLSPLLLPLYPRFCPAGRTFLSVSKP